MSLVHLTFVRGQSDRADSKIAPLGVLKKLENGRIDRAGRIVKRFGFATGSRTRTDGTSPTTVQALASRADERVMIADDAVHAWMPTLARWRKWNPIPRVSAAERHGGARGDSDDVRAPSVTYANGYACLVYEEAAISRVTAIVYDVATWTVRDFQRLSTSGAAPRVIACGNVFVAVWHNPATNDLVWSKYDTSVTGASWAASAVYIPGPVANQFDCCAYDSSSFLTSLFAAGTTVFGFHSALSTGATLNFTSFASAAPGTNAITGRPSEGTSIAWIDAGGAVKLRSWQPSGGNPFGGAASGPTAVNTTATNQGAPLVCRKTSTEHGVGWVTNEADPPAGSADYTSFKFYVTNGHAAAPGTGTTVFGRVRPVSKAFFVGTRFFFLGVNKSTFDRSLVLMSEGPGATNGERVIETYLARSAAVDYDSARNYSDLSSYVDASGTTQLVLAFPFIQSGSVLSADPFTAVDVATFKLESGAKLRFVQYGSALYATGGLLTFFDGKNAHELGFIFAPKIYSLTPQAGAGSMTSSKTYRYLMTLEVYDLQGSKHLSQVSDVYTVALGVGQNQVLLAFDNACFSNRYNAWESPGSTINAVLHIWRTSADGTLFQRVTNDDGLAVSPFPGTANTGSTYTDQMSDATLAAQPVVYTQGVRGGLSGPLQHDPAPPCRYLAIGKARAIAGGLEQVDEVRFSKFFFPGEPLEWSDDFAFRRRVQGTVTEVAYLDDTAIVFTAERIFAIAGDGPDDSGSGSFADPVAIPSEGGCIDCRSVVVTPIGIFFQLAADRIYLLPRGGGSPVWIGEPVRDTLAANPTITSALLIADKGLVVFTCGNASTPSARTLVYDLRTEQWSVDSVAGGAIAPFKNATVWGGLQVLNFATGYYLEDSTVWSDAGVWYGVTIETQALRPHGLQADGRTRKLGVLGEYRATSNLDVSIAVDDAQAYATGPSWSLPFSGAAAGDPFRVEWRLPVQKFGSARVRVRELQSGGNLTEGLRFTGLTLETEARRGMPRLAIGQRG